MENIKTALSIEKPLAEQVDAVARKMKISRNRVFRLALEDFIRRHQDTQLLERINAAYADSDEPSERALRRAMRPKHRKIVEGTW